MNVKTNKGNFNFTNASAAAKWLLENKATSATVTEFGIEAEVKFAREPVDMLANRIEFEIKRTEAVELGDCVDTSEPGSPSFVCHHGRYKVSFDDCSVWVYDALVKKVSSFSLDETVETKIAAGKRTLGGRRFAQEKGRTA